MNCEFNFNKNSSDYKIYSIKFEPNEIFKEVNINVQLEPETLNTNTDVDNLKNSYDTYKSNSDSNFKNTCHTYNSTSDNNSNFYPNIKDKISSNSIISDILIIIVLFFLLNNCSYRYRY